MVLKITEHQITNYSDGERNTGLEFHSFLFENIFPLALHSLLKLRRWSWTSGDTKMARVLRTRVFLERRELYRFRGPLRFSVVNTCMWGMYMRLEKASSKRTGIDIQSTHKPINTAFPSNQDEEILTSSQTND